MLSGKVEGSLKDGIGEISFSSEKANCLDSTLLNKLISKIKMLSSEPTCKVLYLKSEGKAFCAGAYFEELKSIKSEIDAEAFFSLFGEVTVSLREAPQPIIIRLQGPVVGGGVGILAAADLAFGTKDSSVKLSEFEVGIGPFVISPVIEAKIGGARLMELALSGVPRGSDWCFSAGLLSEVLGDQSELEAAVQNALKKISNYSLDNTSTLKRIITPSNLRELVKKRAKIAGRALVRA